MSHSSLPFGVCVLGVGGTLLSPLGFHMPQSTIPCVDTFLPCLGPHQTPLHGSLLLLKLSHLYLQKPNFLSSTKWFRIELYRTEGKRKRSKKMNSLKSF